MPEPCASARRSGWAARDNSGVSSGPRARIRRARQTYSTESGDGENHHAHGNEPHEPHPVLQKKRCTQNIKSVPIVQVGGCKICGCEEKILSAGLGVTGGVQLESGAPWARLQTTAATELYTTCPASPTNSRTLPQQDIEFHNSKTNTRMALDRQLQLPNKTSNFITAN
jgi:hypothetical protein